VGDSRPKLGEMGKGGFYNLRVSDIIPKLPSVRFLFTSSEIRKCYSHAALGPCLGVLNIIFSK
jgi:hypothetical protein